MFLFQRLSALTRWVITHFLFLNVASKFVEVKLIPVDITIREIFITLRLQTENTLTEELDSRVVVAAEK